MSQDKYNGPYGAYPPSYNAPNGDPRNNIPNGAQYGYEWNFDAMYKNSVNVRRKRRGLKVFAVTASAIVAMAVLCFTGYGVYGVVMGDWLDNKTPIQQSSVLSSNSPQVTDMPNVNIDTKPQSNISYVEEGYTNKQIYQMVSPSVVGIVTPKADGSGIIMSADGYIITNAHVLENSNGDIKVFLSTGEYVNATLVGTDVQTDLAVIKVSAPNLKPANFGKSADLEIGDRILAIGNPGGVKFSSSLSVGWVSGLNRVLSDTKLGYSLAVIQVNASINPGNSGGALINAYGQVVGINSSKISATDYEGMGFAIPIDDAMPLIEDLIKNGRITGRAMLGISVSEINDFTARFNGVPMGIHVRDVSTNQSVTDAGIMVGDIITNVGGRDVSTLGEVAYVLKSYKPGDTIDVKVYRVGNGYNTGTTFTAKITLVGS